MHEASVFTAFSSIQGRIEHCAGHLQLGLEEATLHWSGKIQLTKKAC